MNKWFEFYNSTLISLPYRGTKRGGFLRRTVPNNSRYLAP